MQQVQEAGVASSVDYAYDAKYAYLIMALLFVRCCYCYCCLLAGTIM